MNTNMIEAEKFNKAIRKAIRTETYYEFLQAHGFEDAWEVLEHLLNLLYPQEERVETNNSIQNLNTMEGKKAKRIYYGKDGEYVQEAKTADGCCTEIILTSNYHGEYDLVWFIVFENGIEKSRYNAKYIETIEWEL